METTLLLSLCLLVPALVLLIVRSGVVVTPFHFCIFFLAAEVWLAANPAMIPDGRGLTFIEPIGAGTVVVISAFSLVVLICACLIRKAADTPPPVFRVSCRVPKHVVLLGYFSLALLGPVVAYKQLGTLPIFMLARSTDSTQIVYTDVFQGFVTFLGWGGGRALVIWLGVELAMHRGTLWDGLKTHWFHAVIAAGAVVFNALDGVRSNFILPALFLCFALSAYRKIGIKHYVVAAAAVAAAFVIIGVFRSGGGSQAYRLVYNTGNVLVDNTLASFVTYVEPNVLNLNNLVLNPPPPSYGLVLATQLLPDSLFKNVPLSAIEHMASSGLLSHPGLTARTAFADYLVDFGLGGAFVIVAALYAVCTFSYNRMPRRPVYLVVYLLLSLGVFSIPFNNSLIGIPVIICLSLLLFIRFEPLPPAAASPRPSGSRGEALKK